MRATTTRFSLGKSDKRHILAVVCAAYFMATSTMANIVSMDYAIQTSAVLKNSPASITLDWIAPVKIARQSYSVYRKDLDAASWGTPIATLSGTTYSYTDTKVTVGQAYEYQITAKISNTTYEPHGYIYAGIEVPAIENRGTIILLVDNTIMSGMVTELTRLQQDLNGDGWKVIRHDVSRTASVPSIKKLVVDDYNADPKNVKALFLFGHIPVPYSGDINPDGHAKHQGAWGTDGYYGDIDGIWTDNTVKSRIPRDNAGKIIDDPAENQGYNWSDMVRNENNPGDGKFDQSFFPSDVELEVGRVDLSNQYPNGSHTESSYLKNYLNKDHNFRMKTFNLRRRGIIQDAFGTWGNFSIGAFNDFSAMFGPGSIDTSAQNQFLTDISKNQYLWSYSTGPGGWTGSVGLGSTGWDVGDFYDKDVKSVFVGLWGSFYGDWDHAQSLLRAPLTTNTYTLACAWDGAPYWHFEHMALGKEIGYSTKLSMNNSETMRSYPNWGTKSTRSKDWDRHVGMGLMGDPTLRMHMVSPVSNLKGSSSANSAATLTWTASPDNIVGYNIYRSPTGNGDYIRLNTTPVTTTTFTDKVGPSGTYTYMVRAVKLETSGSGSYYNLSQGISVSGITTTGIAAPLATKAAARPIQMDLLRLDGSVVQTRFLSSSNDVSFDLSRQKPGVYLVRTLDAQNRTNTVKLLVAPSSH